MINTKVVLLANQESNNNGNITKDHMSLLDKIFHPKQNNFRHKVRIFILAVACNQKVILAVIAKIIMINPSYTNHTSNC